MDGHTAVGTRPADIVEAIYRHPFSTQYTTNGQPVTSHPPIPTYLCPPPDPHITLGNLTNSTFAIDGEIHDDDDTTDSEFSSSSLEIREAGEGDGVSSERRGEEAAMEEHNRSRDSGGPGDSDPEPGLDDMENGDEGPEPSSAEARVSAALPSAHAALQAWALSLVLHQIDLEMRSLTAGEVLRASNASFTWDFLFNFSLGTAQDAIVTTAPFLWLILTTVAIGGRMRRGVSSGQTKDRKGRRINRRNPWLVSYEFMMLRIWPMLIRYGRLARSLYSSSPFSGIESAISWLPSWVPFCLGVAQIALFSQSLGGVASLPRTRPLSHAFTCSVGVPSLVFTTLLHRRPSRSFYYMIISTSRRGSGDTSLGYRM